MFNKVVRWHRLGEVENVYVAYNFSHFAIYLPKFIKIGGNNKQKQKCTVFFLKHSVNLGKLSQLHPQLSGGICFALVVGDFS